MRHRFDELAPMRQHDIAQSLDHGCVIDRMLQAIGNARKVTRQCTFEIDNYWLSRRFLGFIDSDPGVEA
jgi:hypothetical protein